MTRGQGFIAGWLLLASALPGIYAGNLEARHAGWWGLTGGILLLLLAAGEGALGRHQVRWPRLELAVAAAAVTTLGGLWTWFFVADLGQSEAIVATAAVPAGMLLLPMLRWLGSGRPALPYWGSIAVVAAFWTFGVADRVPGGTSDYAGQLGTLGRLFAGSVTVGALGAWLLARFVRGGGGAPIHPVRTALAGGLVGLAHCQVWLLVRLAEVQESWSGPPTDAYFTTAFGTMLVLYGLGPSLLAMLLAPNSDLPLAEATAQT